MDERKRALARADEVKAAIEGALAITSRALTEDTKDLANFQTDCMTKDGMMKSGSIIQLIGSIPRGMIIY